MKLAALLLACCAMLNLNAQSWEPSVSLPSTAPGRNHPITFSIGDTGYVLTGYGASGNSEMNDFYKFIPSTGEWIDAGTFPGGRRGFGYGVAYNGKAYAGFGLFVNSVYRDFWEYDPKTGQWTEMASCPGTPRWHPAMVPADGKIYMGLGSSAIGDLQDWWEYDISSNTWTQKTDLPGSRRHHPFYFGIDDMVYAGFGHSGANIFNDFYRYDPSNDTWTQVATLPGEGRVAGTQFSYDGMGYVLSGQGEDHLNLDTGEFWQYDPNNDSWKSMTPHPGTGRWAPGSFVIGNKAYFLCGRSNTEEKDMWTYTFPLAASLGETQEQNLEIYPNPFHENIQIQGLGTAQIESASLTSVTGAVHQNLQLNNAEIGLGELNLPNGMYILNIQLDNGNSIQERIVKQ